MAAELSRKSNLTAASSSRFIGEVFEILGSQLAQGGRIEIRGFGTFQVKTAKPRKGRNPKEPKKEYDIPARKVAKFKVSKGLLK